MTKRPEIIFFSFFLYRTEGLLKAGAMKEAERPMWFDVYKAFPPKIPPRFDRTEPTDPIRTIFYPEDIIRA